MLLSHVDILIILLRSERSAYNIFKYISKKIFGDCLKITIEVWIV